MTTRNRVLIGALLLLGSAVARGAAASSVETFVLAVGGQSIGGPGFSCSTFSPATPALAFFGGVSAAVPTDGLAPCSIAGGYRTQTVSTVLPIADTTSIATSFNSGTNSLSGSAHATARPGSVGAEAHATFTGPSNGGIVKGTTSYGLFNESLTASSPSVPPNTQGTVRLTFTVDGSLSVTGPPPFTSTADVELYYQIDNGPNFTLMRAQANDASTLPFAGTGTGAPLTGFTRTPGSLTGSGLISSFGQPFVWGTAFNLKFGVLAAALPATSATNDVNFATTATLTGIELFANGQPVSNFTLVSGSGMPYDAQGVPEPSVTVLCFFGVAGVAVCGGLRGARWRILERV